jgi:hypothetical protein
MALINVQNVIVLDNPTAFTNDFQFEITFEALTELKVWNIALFVCRFYPIHSLTPSFAPWRTLGRP